MKSGVGTKYAKRSARASYIGAVVGLTLVLFMLGIVGATVLVTNSLRKSIRENVKVDVFFMDHVKRPEILRIESALKTEPFVLNARYVTSEEAFEVIKEDVGGEEAAEIFEGSPLPNSIELRLHEEYVEVDSIAKIREYVESKYQDQVLEVHYYEAEVKEVSDKSRSFILYILALAILLLIVAVALINNTIRLSIYSKRFLIKTMTLVGARATFIRRPFLWKAMVQGLISACLAIGLFIGLILLVSKMSGQVFDMVKMIELRMFVILFGGIVLFGILISWIATFFALRKFIRIKTDDLY